MEVAMFATLISGLMLAAILLSLSSTSAYAQEHMPDSNTLLLLHFTDTTNGASGETPTISTGVSFESGVFGKGAYLSNVNQLKDASAGNISPTAGTLEFWIKPRWNANDGFDHYMLRNGLSGGVLIGKDGGNFWRSIFNRFGPSGPEIGTGHFITSEWLANQWHHSAFTWGPSSLKLYIDGKLAASSVPAVAPPVVSDPDLQLGADGLSAGVDAVLDELRISDRERTAAEVFDSFIRGLTLTSLSANPSTVDILATWPITIRLTAATNLGSIDVPMSSATWMI